MNELVHASLVVRGASPERSFAARLDVTSFPGWAFGLKRARVLGGPDVEPGLVPGTVVEFALSAAGITHTVASTVTAVEAPRRIEWRYTKGAVGRGGWTLEEAGSAVRMTLFTDYEVKPAWLNRLANRPFFRGVTEDLLRRSMRRFAERFAQR